VKRINEKEMEKCRIIEQIRKKDEERNRVKKQSRGLYRFSEDRDI
jgi:hypothetical protein